MAEIIVAMCRDCERHVAGYRIPDEGDAAHDMIGAMTVESLRMGYAIVLFHTDSVTISGHGPKCPTGAKINQAEGDGLCVCLDCGAKQQLLTPAWEGACPLCGLWRVYRPEPSPEPEDQTDTVAQA